MNLEENRETTKPIPALAHHHVRWLPVAELVPGMTTARTVLTTTRGIMDFKIPANTELSETLINQLVSRGVSCIAVEHPSPPSEVEYAEILANYNARLLMIFGANSTETVKAHCKPLFDALLRAGPAL